MIPTRLLLGLTLAAALASAACNGCRSSARPESAPTATADGAPTLRLYAISNLAGALEPCGCTLDQLGGVDRLAALLAKDKGLVQSSLLVAAGPTMFLDPRLEDARSTQDRWKAEAIGGALGDMGLAAWTPGFNDWAGGGAMLASLAKSTGGSLLAANLEGDAAGAAKSAIKEVAGVKVGVVGVSVPLLAGAAPEAPKGAPQRAPDDVRVKDAAAAMKAAVAEVRAAGAKVVIGLAAMPRGDALRLAETVPDLTVLLIGKPSDAGDLNDAPPPAAMVGGTLVIGTSNHLQTVGVVDFFVRGGDYKFQDGSGVENAEALASVSRRLRELEARVVAWESNPSVRQEELAARRIDLANLRSEKERLSNPPAPKAGSFFRYALVEIRAKLGRDAKVQERMTSFYRRVNDHNRTAFAGRKPPEIPRGGSGYVGIELCSSCHEEERKVWDRTAHAKAYSTLSTQFKEYNLDCVSCHVTGYEKPGGATVTLNESLRDVQCEECHGPGQAHAKAPDKKGLITREPKLETCVGSCHHPPHVEGFDPVKAKQLILGPGHGMPDDAPWPAWARDAGAADASR